MDALCLLILVIAPADRNPCPERRARNLWDTLAGIPYLVDNKHHSCCHSFPVSYREVERHVCASASRVHHYVHGSGFQQVESLKVGLYHQSFPHCCRLSAQRGIVALYAERCSQDCSLWQRFGHAAVKVSHCQCLTRGWHDLVSGKPATSLYAKLLPLADVMSHVVFTRQETSWYRTACKAERSVSSRLVAPE